MNVLQARVRSWLCTLALVAVAPWLTPRSGAAETEPIKPDALRLVPFPKHIEAQPGAFALGQAAVLEVAGDLPESLARVLNAELQRAGLRPVEARLLDSSAPAFRLAAANRPLLPPAPPSEGAPEGYALDVRADGIVCAAKTPAGLFFGLQTLCQLIRANRQGDALPCLTIRDWPSLRWRAFQDDMTRGPSSTLDNLEFEGALGAYLKFNLMSYYMEYQFAFQKHPEIGPTNGSLTPEELSALVEFTKPLHLDILGSQQSFGHFGAILQHTQYVALRETPDVLTPVRDESYRLLDDLYSEVCPRLPFPWFNVCCDETDGLGSGPAKELAAKVGVGGVYVRHVSRIHDLLRDHYQKRMMMWGDIILQHPGNLAQIPKDTILLSWGYDPRASFDEQIVPFAKSGYEFFVCPGVNDWNRILPDFDAATTNIRNFVRDGVRHGALGMMNTDWEDDAEALKAVKWHADAWAAECAWNASATPLEAFNRRVGAVLFGETADHFGQAVELLARTHRMPAMKDMFNARFWEKDFVPRANPAAIQAAASNVLAVVRPALDHLRACRGQALCNQHILDVFEFGALRMELIGQRMLDGLEAAQIYAKAYAAPGDAKDLDAAEQLVRKNRDAHEKMGHDFARLWLSESRPFALDWTLRRYTDTVKDYDALLGRLDAARTAVAAGRPLPSPEEVGLALPEAVFRRVKPREHAAAPLAPDSPWADDSATHRIGLAIAAGAADRFDLPVEVELTLPPALEGKPVRAFRLGKDQAPRELSAQLDPLGTRGKARLILLLPGQLPERTEATVQVYLGLTRAPAPLPAAVSASPATNGMRWIENDQVRLLLGPEGAHVYRWEIKALGNRDLTMPGETDWAGFGDILPHRNASYRLECKARGPALVEYECSDPWGHSHTIRLYAGVSWMEVLLSEPTSLYWDFDDPRNFAADGPTPGTWLFSNGRSGPLGRQADGLSAQVKASDCYWGVKYNADRLALGLVSPETTAAYVIAPGAGFGGVGIEGSPPVRHLVTYAGRLTGAAGDTMDRLQATLDLDHPIEVRLYATQAR